MLAIFITEWSTYLISKVMSYRRSKKSKEIGNDNKSNLITTTLMVLKLNVNELNVRPQFLTIGYIYKATKLLTSCYLFH